MAQVSVDFTVMREKAKTIDTAAVNIDTLFSQMLQIVTATANSMEGTTVETQKKRFASMETAFETFKTDMQAYAKFLKDAADEYERIENEGTQRAEEQGKIF